MTASELATVVAAIREVLEAHGHGQMAAWLDEREQVLKSAASPAEVTATVAELHSIVLGMGGLFDLPLASTSKGFSEAARARLDGLADRLYDLTAGYVRRVN